MTDFDVETEDKDNSIDPQPEEDAERMVALRTEADAYELALQRRQDQQFKELSRDARAIFKSVHGWQSVRREQDWPKVLASAQADYDAGAFLIEQLGAARFLDPPMMATLHLLRADLLASGGHRNAHESMLADLAIVAYYNAMRIQAWIGNLSLIIERELFGQKPLEHIDDPVGGRSVEDKVRRIGEQLMPLLERANRMMSRNLAALREARRGPTPAIAIGAASQVNIAAQQVNNSGRKDAT
jgi:hypothetical protein